MFYVLKMSSHVLCGAQAFQPCFPSKGWDENDPCRVSSSVPDHTPSSGLRQEILGTWRHGLHVMPSDLALSSSRCTRLDRLSQKVDFPCVWRTKNVPVSVEMICSSARLKLTEWDYGLCLRQACCHCSKWRGSPEREELPERRCVWR